MKSNKEPIIIPIDGKEAKVPTIQVFYEEINKCRRQGKCIDEKDMKV